MENTPDWKPLSMESIVRGLLLMALGLALLAFLGITLGSFTQTTAVEIQKKNNEAVLFLDDHIVKNICVFLAVIALVIFTARNGKTIERINPYKLFGAVAIILIVCGFIWVSSVGSIPGGDSVQVYSVALSAASGDYTCFQGEGNYFSLFPYQLGYVAIVELCIRMFGAHYVIMGVLNVFFVISAYGAIAMMCMQLFEDRKITIYCILLLGLCWQPLLFCTFIYGNILGFAASAWAVYFFIRYGRTQKTSSMIAFVLLLSLAVVVKQNFWLVAIALCIVLFLQMLLSKRFKNLFAMGLILVVPILMLHAVVSIYEVRSHTVLQDSTEVPFSAWFAMGLQESNKAPGWYNGYTYKIMPENDFDPARVNAQIQSDINSRLKIFANDPAYAIDFFTKKSLSQWNDTEFQSIWISEVKGHTAPVPTFVTSIYSGTARQFLREYFNQYMQFLYAAFCLGIVFICITLRKRVINGNDISLCVFPLILIGCFLYHLLFEAKSQYSIAFIPFMMPVCAYGLSKFSAWCYALIRGKKVKYC